MNKKPIIVVAGEPYSIFLEIFFKSLKTTIIKNPIILIGSQKLIIKQMLRLKYDFNINLISEYKLDFNLIDNKKINLIDVNLILRKHLIKLPQNQTLILTSLLKLL